MPREIIAGRDNEPYAQKTELGWGIIGNVSRSELDFKESEHEPTHVTHRTVQEQLKKTLETDSFINALHRFRARHGLVRELRSDQGTNITGAQRELREALTEMNQNKVRSFLLERECDWFYQ